MTMTEALAGQAINEAVHRRVFGHTIPTQAEMRDCAYRVWRDQPAVQFFSDLGGFHVEPVNDAAGARPYNKDDARFVASVPNYSTDIAAAWLVVERMRAGGYEVTVWGPPNSRTVSCEIAKPEWRGSECEEATTAPLAICRAALAAV